MPWSRSWDPGLWIMRREWWMLLIRLACGGSLVSFLVLQFWCYENKDEDGNHEAKGGREPLLRAIAWIERASEQLINSILTPCLL